MRKLVIHQKGEAAREYVLDRERVTIGRHPGNDIALDDKGTSGKHAIVITIGHNSYLQDLGSTNGTLVNGAPISKHTLRHGDVILIGGTHFGYQDVPDKSPEAPKPSPKSEFEFLPLNSPQAPAPVQAAGSAPVSGQGITNAPKVDLIDQMINAIQSHKTFEDTTKGTKARKIQQEWVRVMDYAEKLKAKIGSNPKVKYFSVSRKSDDIMIRVPDHGGRTEKLYMIAPRHPDGKSGMDAIWLRVTGEKDQHFDNADDITRELIASLSHLF